MKHLSLLILLAFSLVSEAQNVYTIDGANLGDRETFINQCIGENELEFVEIGGITTTKRTYCTCMADQVVPHIPSAELITALDTEMIVELITSPAYFPYYEACASTQAYGASFDYNDPIAGNEMAAAMINVCIEEIRNDPSASSALSEVQAFDYCSCLINTFIDRNIPFEELSKIIDETHPLYNEVIIPCMTEAINKELAFDYYVPESEWKGGYSPDDISGGEDSTVVQLSETDVITMPIGIATQERAFVVAMDEMALTITSELEAQLLSTGWLSLEDDLGTFYVEGPDGGPVETRQYYIHNVQVGSYLLQNVYCFVRDDIPMTAGVSLFQKFSDYYINEKNQLILLR